MPRYHTPDIPPAAIMYRGRRYWVVRLPPGAAIAGMSGDQAEIVVYDRAHDVVIALAREISPSQYEITLWAHVHLVFMATSPKEVASVAVREIKEYHRVTG